MTAFEGMQVTDFEARLPPQVVGMDRQIPIGASLELRVRVHVKSVRYDDRDGVVVRHHVLAIDEVDMVKCQTPDPVITVGF